MEVLTEVDEERIADPAGARRVLLARPARALRRGVRARRQHARPAPDGDGGHARVRPAPEGRRLRVARPGRLLHRAHQPRATGRRSRSRSRSTSTSRATSSLTVRQEDCDLLDDLHDALLPEGTEAEDYLVYRIFDTLTDAWYPVINAIETQVDSLEARGVRARPPRAALAHLPAAAGGARAPPADGRAARPLPAGRGGDPQPRRPHAAARRSTCATSATTSRRSRASSTASTRT